MISITTKGKEPSWVRQERYKRKVYLQVKVSLPKELVKDFREKCAETGISQARVIKEAIESFLDE